MAAKPPKCLALAFVLRSYSLAETRAHVRVLELLAARPLWRIIRVLLQQPWCTTPPQALKVGSDLQSSQLVCRALRVVAGHVAALASVCYLPLGHGCSRGAPDMTNCGFAAT